MTLVNCVDKRKTTESFDILPIGTWFMYDTQLYMKMPPFIVENSPSEYPSNAVDQNGNDYGFDDDDQVEIIENLSIEIKK